MNFERLIRLFADTHCNRLYVKPLAPNDNSKNQVYLGPNFQALNLLPHRDITSEPGSRIFCAGINFGWLLDDGAISPAPGAQLILYPQYPEVRMSGFLRGSAHAPSELMRGRMEGRILFLGVTGQNILGYVVGGSTSTAREFNSRFTVPTVGVFTEVPLPCSTSEAESRARLLRELRRIHNLKWIDSKQLDSRGQLADCNAPQCGGFTLEAELGIPKNSSSQPDFMGYEVKQHNVPNFKRLNNKMPITLMTPEPTGGYYRTAGVDAFIRKYGYEDRRGVSDRINFGGIHRVGERQRLTGLRMELSGYNDGKIIDPNGAINLVSNTGEIAASWAFIVLLQHWSRKHMKAVYVPSMCRTKPRRQYQYCSTVRLAYRTDGLRLLSAFANKEVYYDPGIKLVNASRANPQIKRRSQFRIASNAISSLYETLEIVEVTNV